MQIQSFSNYVKSNRLFKNMLLIVLLIFFIDIYDFILPYQNAFKLFKTHVSPSVKVGFMRTRVIEVDDY